MFTLSYRTFRSCFDPVEERLKCLNDAPGVQSTTTRVHPVTRLHDKQGLESLNGAKVGSIILVLDTRIFITGKLSLVRLDRRLLK